MAIERGDVPLQIVVNQILAQTHHDLADYAPAVDLLEHNLALIGDRQRSGSASLVPAVTSRQALSWCLAWQGRFDRAVPVAMEALRLAGDHPASLASAHRPPGSRTS